MMNTIQGGDAEYFLRPINQFTQSAEFRTLMDKLSANYAFKAFMTAVIGVLVNVACAIIELSFGTNLGLTIAFFFIFSIVHESGRLFCIPTI